MWPPATSSPLKDFSSTDQNEGSEGNETRCLLPFSVNAAETNDIWQICWLSFNGVFKCVFPPLASSVKCFSYRLFLFLFGENLFTTKFRSTIIGHRAREKHCNCRLTQRCHWPQQYCPIARIYGTESFFPQFNKIY